MGWFYRGQRLLRRVSSYRVSVYAANASFYIILSVFPAIVLVLSLLPYTRLSQSDLLTALSGVIPSVLEPALAYIISDLSQKANGAVASLSALMAVWSSSRGVYCIQLGLNAICGRRESRSYLHTRIVSMLYTVFMIAALLLTLTLHVFGNQLALYFARQPVPILQLLAKILQFRGLILWLLLTALFTAVMTVFPNQKVRLRDAAPAQRQRPWAGCCSRGCFPSMRSISAPIPCFTEACPWWRWPCYGSMSACPFSSMAALSTICWNCGKNKGSSG